MYERRNVFWLQKELWESVVLGCNKYGYYVGWRTLYNIISNVFDAVACFQLGLSVPVN